MSASVRFLLFDASVLLWPKVTAPVNSASAALLAICFCCHCTQLAVEDVYLTPQDLPSYEKSCKRHCYCKVNLYNIMCINLIGVLRTDRVGDTAFLVIEVV